MRPPHHIHRFRRAQQISEPGVERDRPLRARAERMRIPIYRSNTGRGSVDGVLHRFLLVRALQRHTLRLKEYSGRGCPMPVIAGQGWNAIADFASTCVPVPRVGGRGVAPCRGRSRFRDDLWGRGYIVCYLRRQRCQAPRVQTCGTTYAATKAACRRPCAGTGG
ncbi:hypothetical protein D9M73_113860 [compost metagenome]